MSNILQNVIAPFRSLRTSLLSGLQAKDSANILLYLFVFVFALCCDFTYPLPSSCSYVSLRVRVSAIVLSSPLRAAFCVLS